jgi:hypothetical protein
MNEDASGPHVGGAHNQKAAAEASFEVEGPSAPASSRGALSEIGRVLAPEELSSSGAQKLIIELLDRAEAECKRLHDYEDKYHECFTRAAVLEARVQNSTAFEVLYSASIVLGGLILGLYQSLAGTPLAPWALAIGALFIVGAIAAKLASNK